MQTQTLNVTGMTCGGCVSNVTKALKSLAGVGEVKVSLADGQAVVHYEEGQTTPTQLERAVIGAGFGVTAGSSKVSQSTKRGCCG